VVMPMECIPLKCPECGKSIPYLPHPLMMKPYYCTQDCYNVWLLRLMRKLKFGR
jgi:endogenous inhibitor of DNA gyrase (YacG/DUF329 family)